MEQEKGGLLKHFKAVAPESTAGGSKGSGALFASSTLTAGSVIGKKRKGGAEENSDPIG